MKKCKPGEYYCYTDKKCKKIPMGWHIARGGYIEKDDKDDEKSETKKNGNGGSNGNGNGNGNGGAVSEAAVSKAQQRFFGMVRAAQKGEMENPSPEVAKVAASAKRSDVKKFASTKHDKLPEKKKMEEETKYDRYDKEKKTFAKADKKMKFGKFYDKAKEAQTRLRKGEVKKWDPEKKRYVSNRD